MGTARWTGTQGRGAGHIIIIIIIIIIVIIIRCKACRMKKCRDMGMNPARVEAEEERKKRQARGGRGKV